MCNPNHQCKLKRHINIYLHHDQLPMRLLTFTLLLTFFSTSATWAQNTRFEICNNAIDDDGDGLIDLNDTTDCKCKLIEPISLIPNPSFEEYTCCPQNVSQLNCAVTWIQASEATTDYLHNCGWKGRDYLPAPLPFPDGDGIIGFRNGSFGRQNPNPNWKEYTGACLLGPLKANTAYRFKFWIGFTYPQNSPAMDVVFYGTADCKYLPFGQGNERYGCPMNGPGWVELGRVNVSGFNEWKQYEINVTPKEDIKAIAIGPDCVEISWTTDTYYFFDNLVLDERINFEYVISPKNHPCEDEHILGVPTLNGYTYQWYKEGIALVGETSPELTVTAGEGNYQVRIESSNDCRITSVYHHEVPVDETSVTHKICPGNSLRFKNRTLTKQGVYIEHFKSIYNCDSIVTLTLNLEDDLIDSVQTRILEGDFISVGTHQIRTPGRYKLGVTSVLGCDSTVYLDLDFLKVYLPTAFSPNDDGVNDSFGLFANSSELTIVSLRVFDRWGEQVFSTRDLSSEEDSTRWDGTARGKPAPEGVYVYVVNVVLKNGREQMRYGEVQLVR